MSEFDSIAWLPYTQVKIAPEKLSSYRRNLEDGDPEKTHRLSHFSARSLSASWFLAQLHSTYKFILTGEENNPSTCDLAEKYLTRKSTQEIPFASGEVNLQTQKYPDVNGTPQQLDRIADLQNDGDLGRVLIPVFNFHFPRTEELVRRWGIDAQVIEIEQTQQDYLQLLAQARWLAIRTGFDVEENTEDDLDGFAAEDEEFFGIMPDTSPEMSEESVSPIFESRLLNRLLGNVSIHETPLREVLVSLPQVIAIDKIERKFSNKLMILDKPFGRKAPASRLAKRILGPTLTDIKVVGLKRKPQRWVLRDKKLTIVELDKNTGEFVTNRRAKPA